MKVKLPFAEFPRLNEKKKREKRKIILEFLPKTTSLVTRRVQNHLDRFEIGPRRGWHALKDGKLPRREKTE